MATITCEQCGYERKGAPSNTRLCRLCVIERDITYWVNDTRHCIQLRPNHDGPCRTVFAPLNRGDRTCGNCARSTERGTCGICGCENVHLLHKHIRICMECAKDPAKRSWLIDELERKRLERSDTESPKRVITDPRHPDYDPDLDPVIIRR